MTLMVQVRDHVHGQSKSPLSSVHCDHWEQNMMWSDRDLLQETITKTTVGG